MNNPLSHIIHSPTHALYFLFITVTQFFTFTHTSFELGGGARKARDWGAPKPEDVGQIEGAARDADFGGRVATAVKH